LEESRRIYRPPLDYGEFERQWKDAVNFINRKSKPAANRSTLQTETDCDPQLDNIVYLKDRLVHEYAFATMKDTDEKYHYDNGRYVRNGEVKIKIKLEQYDRSIRKSTVNEVIEKISIETVVTKTTMQILILLIPKMVSLIF